MKKIIALILLGLLFFITKIILGQVQQEWLRWLAYTNDFGETISYSIALDSTGNVYVTGMCNYNSMSHDFVTIKYNDAGIQQWLQRFNGGGEDEAYAIGVDRSGNVYVTGGSDLGYPYMKYTTIKYKGTTGDVIWVRNKIFPPDSEGITRGLAIDNNNNIYITGDKGTLKYDSSGNQLWYRNYGMMRAILLDANANVYVVGTIYSNFTVVKYSSSGVQQWVGYTSGDGYSIGIDDSLNVYATGNDYSSTSLIRTQKFDRLGYWKWAKFFQGGAICDPHITVDHSGNSYVTGSAVGQNSQSDCLLIKYSLSGAQVWVKTYKGSGTGYNFFTTSTLDNYGNLYISGATAWNNNVLYFTTVKYNLSGAQQWLILTPGGYASPNGIVLKPPDKIFITGSGAGYGAYPSEYVTIKYTQFDEVRKIGVDIPASFSLYQNFPNPFNPVTEIKFELPKTLLTKLIVFDLLGRQVATLVNEELTAGTYETEWNGNNNSSGIYLYKLITDSYTETRKMVLVK